MALKKNGLVLTMVLLIGCFLCACGNKDNVAGESLVEDTEEVSGTEETKTGEKEAAEQWEKGYGLPIDEREMDEAENDCSAMMEHIYEIYNEADKGTASNVVLTDEVILELQKKLMKTGYPVAALVPYSNMGIMKAWILSLKIAHLGKTVLWYCTRYIMMAA